MLRTWKSVVVAAALLTASAGAAEAKEISRVVVCGVDGCRTTKAPRQQWHLVDGMPSSGPEAAADRYRGRIIIDHGRQSDVIRVRYAPASGEFFDGSWTALTDRARASWQRASRGLEPFPGSDRKPDAQAPAGDQGADATEAEDKGVEAGLIAGGVLAFGAVAWAATRRLRRQG